jgi:hypothetical protein
MPRSNRFSIDLLCPGCGRTGLASVITGGIGIARTASAGKGFYVHLAPDNSLSIACSGCGATTYEAE